MAIFGTKTEEQKEEKTEQAAPAASSATMVKVPSILIMPRVSEKAGHLAGISKYVFKVKKDANKVEVKKAVEAAYKVKVIQVNIINNKGKGRNFGQISGKTSGFKKAIVTLKTGDKIEGLTDVV